jgi:hypothetical protein
LTGPDELLPYLPRRSDSSLESYAGRLRGAEAREFTLVFERAYAFSPILRQRAGAFVRPLYERVAMPAKEIDIDIFLGCYRHTPFGVHKDAASNFSFGIHGRKLMRVWPGDYFAEHMIVRDRRHERVRQAHYEECRDSAHALELEPGDIAYWPSSYWHVGESPDFSVSLNLALYLDGDPLQQVLHEVQRLLAADPASPNRADLYPCSPSRLQQSVQELPPVLYAARRMLQRVCESPALDFALLGAWMGRATLLGFSIPEEPLPPARLGDDWKLRREPSASLVWRWTTEGDLLCAANGYWTSLPVADPEPWRKLLDHLSAGRAFTPRRIVDEAGAEAPAIRELLDLLYRWRALRVSRD